jgi:hypothetical protein
VKRSAIEAAAAASWRVCMGKSVASCENQQSAFSTIAQ